MPRMMTPARHIIVASLLVMAGSVLLLAACGGGGGGGGGGGVSSTIQMGGARQGVALNLSTVVTTLAGTPFSQDGTGAAANFKRPAQMVATGGSLYVADSDNHTIRQIVIATGVVTTLAGTADMFGSTDGTGAAARFIRPQGITTDGTYLYVADTSNHTIRQIVIASGVVTTLAGTAGVIGSTDATGAAARFNSPQGIIRDGTNLYVADTSNHTIRQIVIATGVVTTLAGTAGVIGSTDATGAAARFNRPQGITTDGTNLYVADTQNYTIRRIVIASGVVTTLAGTAGTSGSTDGTGAAAQFNLPQGIIIDAINTYLYVVDTNNHTLRQIVIASAAVTTFAGTAGAVGSTDGTGAAARFNFPQGITTDGPNLYVADTNNLTIRRIVIATRVVTTLAGTATGADGPVGRFSTFLAQITTDGTNLYVADSSNHSIRQIVIATGAVTTLAGTAGIFGSTDGTGAAARFNYPNGITTDGTNLYVADTSNHTIRQIVIATGAVSTLAGTAGMFGSTDATGTAARFNRPQGITTDGTNLYVADSDSHTVRQIVIATGVTTTLAGTAGVIGSTDATGAAARFNRPQGITTDGTNLYVADTNNKTIRQIVTATRVVTTLAGTAGVNGSTDGTGAAALFGDPAGITTDGTNLYVGDAEAHIVRQIVIATRAVTTLAGTADAVGTTDGTGAAARFNFPFGITTDGQRLLIGDGQGGTLRAMQ